MRKRMPFGAKRQENPGVREGGNPGTCECGEPAGGFGLQQRRARHREKVPWLLAILPHHVLEKPQFSAFRPEPQPRAAITCTSQLASTPQTSQVLRYCIQIIPRQARLKLLRSDSPLLRVSRSWLGDWSSSSYCPTHLRGGRQDSPALGRRNAILSPKATHNPLRPPALFRCFLGIVVFP